MAVAMPAAEARERVTPSTAPPAWAIESADYAGDVQDQIIKLDVRYTIRTIRDGWVEIPLAIPGATITGIEIEKKTGEAYIMPRGDTYVLATSKKGTFKVRVKCSSILSQDSQYEGVSLGIPRATFSTLTLTVPRKEVELRQADALYVEREAAAGRDGTKLTARLGAADRIDLRWRTKPATPVTVEPVVYGEVHTLVTIEEQLARVMSIMAYRMAQGETKELIVRLPADMNILNVRGPGIDDWRVADADGHKTLTVTLNFVLKDAGYQLVVEGEQPIQEGGTSYALPEITLVGVKQERGYVAVARSGSIEVSAGSVEGASRVDVRELPATLSSLSGSLAILAFKYHQHPFQVAVSLARHQDHAVLSAIAELGRLQTVVSRQGALLTRASYLIKANKKQFLEVALPQGATLWSCIVNGKAVKPVEGSEHLMVPLDASTESAAAVAVELVYFEQRPAFEWSGHMTLQGPVLDVPTTISNWSVYAPDDVKLFRIRGNLERGAAAVDFLDEPFVQLAMNADGSFSRTVDEEKDDKRAEPGKLLNPKKWQKERTARLARGVASGTDGYTDAVAERQAPQSPSEVGAGVYGGGGNEQERPERSYREDMDDLISRLAGRSKETGILPLKIQLPKSGKAYHFNRLMASSESLTLEASFVHVPMPVGFLAFLAMVLLPLGGFGLTRFRLLG
ncbi:MAG: hypothetical protein COV75_02320 [Candidatus Omnitrophica bacterium CG11_big_fil_rev_8_21_14_0_20_63_9]|nr:MAG: hypothetical protein COV75_02320 [Candidatus Omnitrophica bacterium CG11_big_fil_rev_8_21_14_0_20_63_9]